MTGDEALDLLKRIKEKDYSPIRSRKPFVICSPIYVCEMPGFFVAFIRKPAWKGICAHCMACIANCPVEAIEYAHVKKGVEKYRIGKYLSKK